MIQLVSFDVAKSNTISLVPIIHTPSRSFRWIHVCNWNRSSWTCRWRKMFVTFNLIFRAPFSETAPQFSIIHTGTRILATFRHAKNQILGSEIVPVLHVQTQYNRLPFADQSHVDQRWLQTGDGEKWCPYRVYFDFLHRFYSFFGCLS